MSEKKKVHSICFMNIQCSIHVCRHTCHIFVFIILDNIILDDYTEIMTLPKIISDVTKFTLKCWHEKKNLKVILNTFADII